MDTTTTENLHYPTEMSEDLAFILGRPNFWCGPYAHVFQAAGHDIPQKAEAEQAFVLNWLVKIYLVHGSEWRAEAKRQLNEAQAIVAAKKAEQETPTV